MSDLRELLEADRDCLLDVVDWLAVMPQENFDKHVSRDVTGQLDDVAHQALRHPRNVERWRDSLHLLVVDVQRQLEDPTRKTPEHVDWRKRALSFQTAVLRRRAEAVEMCRQLRTAKSTAASREAAKNDRREAGERAIQRLKSAHIEEFLGYLAEEYAVDGIPLPDNLYRRLRNIATEDGDSNG